MTAHVRGGGWRMVLAMVLSGTIGLTVVESGLAPLIVVFFRCLIGAAGLLVWLMLSHSWAPVRRKDLMWMLLGGLTLVFNWLFFFSSYRWGSISVSTVIYHTQPFMLLCLAAVFQGEKIQAKSLPWMVLALLGVGLSAQVQGAAGASWFGAVLASVAAFLYAIATLATRQLKHLPASQIAAFQMGVGTLVLLPMVWSSLGPLSPRAWLAVSTLGLLHTAFLYTIMYAAFQRLQAQSIAMLSFIYPLVALLVDLLYFNVRLHWMQQLGMALILLALFANRLDWGLLTKRLRRRAP